ncbi:MAG: amino acid permease [Cryobacterium sp.]|nr:amino acid permease [Oligoflexia bacterium]
MNKTPVKLKVWTAVSLVIGCAIGSGVFVKPGRVLAAAGDANHALLAWVLGGLLSLAGGLTVAEIAFRIPKTGGVYTYMEELYGKKLAFVNGWVQAVIYGPGLMSALALYFGSLFTQFFAWPDSRSKPVALITLYLLATIVAVSTRTAGRISDATTLLKLIPILLIGVAGLAMGENPIFNVSLTNATAGAGMGAAVLACLWAYDGWMQVANIADEIENPAKNLPRAIVFGLVVIMIAYLLVNTALFHVLPIAEIASLNEKAAAVASTKLFGDIGGKLISLGILVSIFGCLNGNILTLTRIPYAIALRGIFPFREKFAVLHPKFHTPVNSIILKALVASVMIVLFNPDRITDLALFIMYLFYGLVFIGIFKLRRIYGKPKSGEYSVPLYPFVPMVAILGCGFICYGMIRQAPMDAIVSLFIAALGFPAYAFLSRNAKDTVDGARMQ